MSQETVKSFSLSEQVTRPLPEDTPPHLPLVMVEMPLLVGMLGTHLLLGMDGMRLLLGMELGRRVMTIGDKP